jgi:hypothetical protein
MHMAAPRDADSRFFCHAGLFFVTDVTFFAGEATL